MAGSTLLLTPVVRPANSQPATPSEATLFSYWSIKPWFLTEGKLAAVLITPYSWGSQRVQLSPRQLNTHQDFLVPLHKHQDFLAPLPGRRSTSARGVSRSQSLYFVFSLLSLFYFILFASLYQKHTKISFYYSCYFCCLVLILLK